MDRVCCCPLSSAKVYGASRFAAATADRVRLPACLRNPVGTDEALLYRWFAGSDDLFTASSGAFTAQRHVEDLLPLTGQPRPDHTGT